MNMKRRPLGRGLDSLIPPAAEPSADNAPVESRSRDASVAVLPVEQLHPAGSQPRVHFDDASLDGLAESIKQMGVLEPLLVRKRAQGDYDIIAGERRWRAAQRAGVLQVPVLIKDFSEKQSFEAALVENLQREDLTAVETAKAYKRLIDEHGHTADTLAQVVGKSRSAIANAVRILQLPTEVLERIEEGQLSEGHGRALLLSKDPQQIVKLARAAVARNWSVRETEKRAKGRQVAASSSVAHPSVNPNVRSLEERLSRATGSTVKLEDKAGRGNIRIHFANYDELDRLIALLSR